MIAKCSFAPDLQWCVMQEDPGFRVENCPSPQQIRQFHSAAISDTDAGWISTHLDECEKCLAIYTELESGFAPVAKVASDDTLNRDSDNVVNSVRKYIASQLSQNPQQPAGAPGRIRDYELLEELGAGGMGVVYRARHTRLEQTVALKLLPEHRNPSPQHLARFDRETKAIGRLIHPNIVRATDAGECDGRMFLAMEFVDGLNLDQLLRQQHPLPIAAIASIVTGAAEALKYAQSQGIVHRDVKPSNLMVARDGTVKLLDLGLARLSDSTVDEGLTGRQEIVGTPGYMAPERWGGAGEVDSASDVYSLGCVLFTLCTGRPPFEFDVNRGLPALMSAHLNEAPPRVSALRQDVPPEIEELIARMLAKHHADRPGFEEVIATLEPWRRAGNLRELVSGTGTVTLPENLAVTHRGDVPANAALPQQKKPALSFWRSSIGVVVILLLLVLAAAMGTSFIVPADSDAAFVVLINGAKHEAKLTGKSLTVVNRTTGHKYVLTVKKGSLKQRVEPGDYLIHVADASGLHVDTEKFELTDGESVAVRVTLQVNGKADAAGTEIATGAGPVTLLVRGADRQQQPSRKHLALYAEQNTPSLLDFKSTTTPDGSVLAKVGQNTFESSQPVEIYRRGESKPFRTLRNASRWPARTGVIAFSPDGRYLLCTSGKRIQIYLTETLELQQSFELEQIGYYIRRAEWLPDCRGLILLTQSGSFSPQVRYFDLERGIVRKSWSLRCRASDVDMSVSPLGDQVALLTVDGLYIWNRMTGQPVLDKPLTEAKRLDNYHRRGVAWRPDGKQLAVRAGSQAVAVYDTQTWQRLFLCNGAAEVASVLFSPSGDQLLTHYLDDSVRMFSARTGKHNGTWIHVKDNWAAVSPEGHFRGFLDVEDHLEFVVSDGQNGKSLLHPHEFAKKYRRRNDPQKVDFPPKDGWGKPRALVKSETPVFPAPANGLPASLVASPRKMKGLIAWGLESKLPPLPPGFSGSLAVDNQGKVTVQKHPQTPDSSLYAIKQRGIYRRGETKPVLKHGGLRMAFSADGRNFAGLTADGKLDIYSTAQLTLEKSCTWQSHAGLVWAPGGAGILGQFNSRVDYFDWRQDRVVHSYQCDPGEQILTPAAVAPAGDLAAIQTDRKTVVWDYVENQVVATIQDTLPVSPERLHEINGATIQGQQYVFQHAPRAAISSDGKKVALPGAGHRAGIYDTRTGKKVVSCGGHQDRVVSLAFSPDGKILASGSLDGVAKVWDSSTGELLSTQYLIPGALSGGDYDRWVHVSIDGHVAARDELREDPGNLFVFVMRKKGELPREVSPSQFASETGWKNDPQRALQLPR